MGPRNIGVLPSRLAGMLAMKNHITGPKKGMAATAASMSLNRGGSGDRATTYQAPRVRAADTPRTTTLAVVKAEIMRLGIEGSRRVHVSNSREWPLTFDMSGGPKGAKRPLGRPLDGGVRSHSTSSCPTHTTANLLPLRFPMAITPR